MTVIAMTLMKPGPGPGLGRTQVDMRSRSIEVSCASSTARVWSLVTLNNEKPHPHPGLPLGTGWGGTPGGGGTQIWFRRGCAAEAAKPVPIFSLRVILAEKGTHYLGVHSRK